MLSIVITPRRCAVCLHLWSSGVKYLPKWTEVAVTLAIVAGGFFVFRMAASYLPIFESEHAEEPAGGVPVLQESSRLLACAKGD